MWPSIILGLLHFHDTAPLMSISHAVLFIRDGIRFVYGHWIGSLGYNSWPPSLKVPLPKWPFPAPKSSVSKSYCRNDQSRIHDRCWCH